MTEAEWLACDDPRALVEFVGDKGSTRKLRLFGVACCRRISQFFKDERSGGLVECAERYADELIGIEELESAFEAAAEAQEAIHWEGGDAVDQSAAEAVLGPRAELYLSQVFEGTMEAVGESAVAAAWKRRTEPQPEHWRERERDRQDVSDAAMHEESAVQATLLRDIFGNPFRTVAFDAAWRTSTVVALARQVYGSRDFGAMPILADALQDAGCDSDDVLNHCRGPGPHVRGCWVIDLVLGKG